MALREALWSDGVPLESEEEEPAASVGWCEFKSAPKPAKGKKKAKPAPGEACFAPRRFVVTLAPNGPVCNRQRSPALLCSLHFPGDWSNGYTVTDPVSAHDSLTSCRARNSR